VTIAYAISTVASRGAACAALIERLPNARVYLDDPPSGGSWNNYRRALLESGGDGESWIVSIDDDARPCVDFPQVIEKALRMCPGDFASFYLSDGAPVRLALAAKATWISTVRIVHGICWAVRTRLAWALAARSDRLVRSDFLSGDNHLLAGLIGLNLRNFVSVPSLVQHRQDLESVMKPERGANRGRHAAYFEKDPKHVRWSGITYRHPQDPDQTLQNLRTRGVLTSEGLALCERLMLPSST
jgi:hypothetical protein